MQMLRTVQLAIGAFLFSSFSLANATESPTAFPFEIEGRIADSQKSGNTIFSPVSLGLVLTMLRAGALGKTAAALDHVLGFAPPTPGSSIETYSAHATALAQVKSTSDCEVSIANRLWVQSGAPLLKHYAALVQGKFGALPESVDFRANPSAAALEINRWAQAATRGRITKLVDEHAMGSAGIVPANAIYFKGAWETPFSKANTMPMAFTIGSGKSVQVPMMRLEGAFKYGERPLGGQDQVGQVVELPYRGGEFSMVFVLPRAKATLTQVASRIAGLDRGIFTGRWNRKVRVILPRFTIDASLELSEILKKAGGGEAFGPQADFSEITGSRGLHVGAVAQRAHIKVDEQGSEAAAATAAVMALSAAPVLGDSVIEFRADRPFFYFIRHRATGLVLLMGRVSNPLR